MLSPGSTDTATSSPAKDPLTTNAAMPSIPPLSFGPFTVTNQIFHLTPLSYALVNLRPLLPGHILICPRRVVPRYSQLTVPEHTDLFLTVRKVSRMLERIYKADSLNIAIQDGAEAGQSVPHVHVHIIPRRKGDMDERGGGDAIYELMEGQEGDLGAHQRVQEDTRRKQRSWRPDNDGRKNRSDEEMRAEAQMLMKEMEKEIDE